MSAKSWLTEAPLRMLMNNLDPTSPSAPEELVVYGGIGRAARDWESFDRIVASLRTLEADETLLVQSGKPVGIFRTHRCAARAHRQLQPRAALGRLGAFQRARSQGAGMMYGQMTAAQLDLYRHPGHRSGHLRDLRRGRPPALWRRPVKGKWVLTAGLGGMGGAQPLAATMAGASMIAVECQPSRIEMRLKTRYLDARPTASTKR
jgi:urocanate hydratase